MMDHEDAFAEEAQEEARLAGDLHVDSTVNTQFHIGDAQDGDDESSPLMNPRQRTKSSNAYTRPRRSFERAINEPWNGAHGSGGLPWYKTPSVCASDAAETSAVTDHARYSGFCLHSFPSASLLAVSSYRKHISSST